VASGALTADVSAEVERLRAQHADAVREKSDADSKCRKLAEKVAALEGERTDLRHQLVEERREAKQAIAKAQAEAKLVRVEGSLASQRAEEWRCGSTLCRPAWRGPRPLHARKLSGRANSSWTHTASWARGLLTSNALSREGCSHYEVFDRSDEDFGREIYKVEDPMVKDSAGALFDRMWGLYGREVVRKRSDRARDQVKFVFCIVSLNVGIRWLC
jgi:hypothetical protein